MSLVTAAAVSVALILSGIVLMWATLKCLKWSLKTEEHKIGEIYTNHLYAVWKLIVLAVLVLELGPGIGSVAVEIGRWLATIGGAYI